MIYTALVLHFTVPRPDIVLEENIFYDLENETLTWNAFNLIFFISKHHDGFGRYRKELKLCLFQFLFN